ncbi:hypothetical protein EHW64_05890 [Erwinia psidii]|uniref:hypothetical protein n=1 Tax=Erwinia psidii TaxID=69224 RepID=UPI00226B25E2|nr:hypothetical protein [Erwinia psidii]MCX8960714.1 hypothetical protein [Erwinia psidii]
MSEEVGTVEAAAVVESAEADGTVVTASVDESLEDGAVAAVSVDESLVSEVAEGTAVAADNAALLIKDEPGKEIVLIIFPRFSVHRKSVAGNISASGKSNFSENLH